MVKAAGSCSVMSWTRMHGWEATHAMYSKAQRRTTQPTVHHMPAVIHSGAGQHAHAVAKSVNWLSRERRK
jgi:hypothetical protein